MTIKKHLDAAIEDAAGLRDAYGKAGHPDAARNMALAITAMEDAQMRATRGIAIGTGRFKPADLQDGPPQVTGSKETA